MSFVLVSWGKKFVCEYGIRFAPELFIDCVKCTRREEDPLSCPGYPAWMRGRSLGELLLPHSFPFHCEDKWHRCPRNRPKEFHARCFSDRRSLMARFTWWIRRADYGLQVCPILRTSRLQESPTPVIKCISVQSTKQITDVWDTTYVKVRSLSEVQRENKFLNDMTLNYLRIWIKLECLAHARNYNSERSFWTGFSDHHFRGLGGKWLLRSANLTLQSWKTWSVFVLWAATSKGSALVVQTWLDRIQFCHLIASIQTKMCAHAVFKAPSSSPSVLAIAHFLSTARGII